MLDATAHAVFLDAEMPSGFAEVYTEAEVFFALRQIAHGERALWLAMLIDAVELLQKAQKQRATRGLRLAKESTEWMEDRGAEGVGSFIWTCEHLDLNPDSLRLALEPLFIHSVARRRRSDYRIKRVKY